MMLFLSQWIVKYIRSTHAGGGFHSFLLICDY